MRIVAISGSLRAGSRNEAVLRAAAAMAPDGMELVPYQGLGDLPHFNPDLDREGSEAPPAVAGLRSLLETADGLIVSSPEYAHGVPGSLKNALDWLVSTDVLGRKPIALINAAASGGAFAQASLEEILTTMGAEIVSRLSLRGPLPAPRPGGGPVDPAVAALLRPCLDALLAAQPRAA